MVVFRRPKEEINEKQTNQKNRKYEQQKKSKIHQSTSFIALKKTTV